MKRWEYKEEELSDPRGKMECERLNELGDDGWELIERRPFRGNTQWLPTVTFLFKREIDPIEQIKRAALRKDG